MTRMTRPAITYEEQDVYTGWRKVIRFYQRAGRVKAVKVRTHRRERREAKQRIKAGDHERPHGHSR